MSAVPKKKLCWNCEGNIAKEIDNCPYCGVYLHGSDEVESFWSSPYRPSPKTEESLEVPSPVYSAEEKEARITPIETAEKEETDSFVITTQLRKDIFPVFFLMTGSIFFLFGIVLLLFSQEGTFTLQWNGENWVYFLGLSVPLLYMGWRFLQQLDIEQ